MLVLTRKVGEEIVINDNIRVTILAIRGNQVRIGFQAPANVSIYRQELLAPAINRETLAEFCVPAATR